MPCTGRRCFLAEGRMLRLGRSLRYGLGTFLLVLPLAGCSRQPAVPVSPQASSPRPSIAFMTDFGTANDAVAICRAVIYGIAPDVRITDITHQVTPFSIEEASRFLYGVTPYYPEGTVFLVVVDPGVGTSRKAIAVKSKKGQYFILPDNGVITAVLGQVRGGALGKIKHPRWLNSAAIDMPVSPLEMFRPSVWLRARRTASIVMR